MLNIPFRKDKFGKNFYIEVNKKEKLIDYKTGTFISDGITFCVSENTIDENVLELSFEISAEKEIPLDRLGFHLGIDSYMDKYPDWNNKFFPTSLRCEKNGFWSCFISPLGKYISVCSASQIVSWRNEYNQTYGDVGHRIYTSSVEFINTYKQPLRHPDSPAVVNQTPIKIKLYYSTLSDKEQLAEFVNKYANIIIPDVNKFTLESGEDLIVDGNKYNGNLNEGLNIIKAENMAELSVFVRKDWFYYLDCARKSAEICQQKPGTHTESWYGYFSMVAYAKAIKNDAYTKTLCDKFDRFFDVLTYGKNRKMRKKALPHRLQNTSCMLSLLADFYELTDNKKYLEYGNSLAKQLMKLQSKADGSYRSHGTHYTCVIYPAKSMLEFALAEKEAGFDGRYKIHYASAYKAIENLYQLKDNIQTEGQMTFEDGMISCESLQLGYLATIVENKDDKKRFTDTAKEILNKHICLEQQTIPDCRTRGCTSRFWEARYDINFFSNMLNSPHGWTSWKTYATYYLYILTGEFPYLQDTMDTIGACMQCVDNGGVLNWSYVADPCIVGMDLVKNCTKSNVKFVEKTVGEEYLPMISDWFRHDEDMLQSQYIRYFNRPKTYKKDYGGSCDNDVHEHFKCLDETVFGKAFIHQLENGKFVTYNCKENLDGTFVSGDKFVSTLVLFASDKCSVIFNKKNYNADKGINLIPV